jgi:hypothetical protein
VFPESTKCGLVLPNIPNVPYYFALTTQLGKFSLGLPVTPYPIYHPFPTFYTAHGVPGIL